MKVYLIDGTYELFRAYYGAPPRKNSYGEEVGACVGLSLSLMSLLKEQEVTHVACAFDHVVESFRNNLFEGYKTGEHLNPQILSQFPLAEELTAALGIVVWPMVKFEADDALATAANRWRISPEVDQILICSPDKDLAQCVVNQQVVCLDRRRETVLDEAGVQVKFGVEPCSIPDWLALVGDTADGIPGIPRWGRNSTAHVLGRYSKLEKIPSDFSQWDLRVRGAEGLSRNLREHWEEVLLYRRLATLRRDVSLLEVLEDLKWIGSRRRELEGLEARLGEPDLVSRVDRWR